MLNSFIQMRKPKKVRGLTQGYMTNKRLYWGLNLGPVKLYGGCIDMETGGCC